MYSCSTLNDSEYIWFLLNIIAHYNLRPLIHYDYIYACIKKTWYDLKQSGNIVPNDLVKNLLKFGYKKTSWTEGLFLHETQDISFTLVVDDFGIKYT